MHANVLIKKTDKTMKENEIRQMLNKGLVSFRYVKKNGDTRNAVGTLNMKLIPSPHHPKGMVNVQSSMVNGAPGLVRYFDFTVQDWRSLYCDEVIEAKPLVLNPIDDYNDAVFEANLIAQGL